MYQFFKSLAYATGTSRRILVCFTVLSVVASVHVVAQIYNPDSLRTAVAQAQTDAGKAATLNRLGDYYCEFNADSAMYYSSLAKEFAIKAKDKSEEGYAITNMADALMRKGEFAEALTLTNDALDILKLIKDSINIANIYNEIGHIYSSQNNYANAKRYYEMEFRLASRINDAIGKLYGAMNLGSTFLNMNMPDSAIHYHQLALKIYDEYKLNWSRSSLLLYLSRDYHQLGDSAVAEAYLGQAFSSAVATGDQHLFQIQTALGNKFVHHNQLDSALYFAQQAGHFLERNNNLAGNNNLYKLLTEIYEKKQDYKQAFLYQKKVIATSDSLNSLDQSGKVADIAFSQKQHEAELRHAQSAYQTQLRFYSVVAAVLILLVFVFFLVSRNKKQRQLNTLLNTQKQKIQATLSALESTQAQLIQAEKMASLGELTAGIAHEIQNPLNFVNNFSEVNRELIEEIKSNRAKIVGTELDELLDDIAANEEKIMHHGKRADAIVKGMLQHSRVSAGQKELTDINALCDEYLRLSYHGLRAKDKAFNADFKTDFDASIETINIVPQDIGRVLLNLFNNAFQATRERSKIESESYQPTVTVITRKLSTATFAANGSNATAGSILITVTDNGTGIPQNIIDKIFQPFFTTKPTGQGTGLGLSLSFDIIKAHGGEVKVESTEGKGTSFIITLPGK